MSWKSISLVQARARFVKLVLKAQQSFAEVCRIFRISRKPGYKWKRRFLRQGLGGLRDRSRRPEVTLAGSESGPLGARPLDS